MRKLLAGATIASLFAVGCAPARFEDGLTYYADQYRVRDAGVRRVSGYWQLRFNELLISDLDDAIAAGESGDQDIMRADAEKVIEAAGSLGQRVALTEIDRLPPRGREDLARLADCGSDADALKTTLTNRARAATAELLAQLATQSADDMLGTLKQMRRAIEPAPGDRGRFLRQLALFWGILPAKAGIQSVDAEFKKQHAAYQDATYDRAVIWTPKTDDRDAPVAKLAPTLIVQWPEDRSYSPEYDRIGKVYLTGTPSNVEVNVDTAKPAVYSYTSQAKIHGRRYNQLCYVWWFPQRPEMKVHDVAAGRIDGDTLRVTLDSQGRPAIFEVLQACGCGHLVYVSKQLEERARQAFGGPLPGKTYVVETEVPNKRDLFVMGTVDVPEQVNAIGIHLLAGYHQVSSVACVAADQSFGVNAVERHGYQLLDYDVLERLPLGGGVASMFGTDGLVHNAGRAEGFLLAPTGMLSAGQPRKRGTQMIRWDEYSFDNPRLLELTLRLPEEF